MSFIGEIRQVAFDFAPQGWLECNGQVLNMTEYSSLYSIIGNTYGGDGVTTFALPNLNNSQIVIGGSKSGTKTTFGIPSLNIPPETIKIILENP